MKAKKRFYWLGVIDANNCRRQRAVDWPRWQRVAYENGQYSVLCPLRFVRHRVNFGTATDSDPIRDLVLERLSRTISNY